MEHVAALMLILATVSTTAAPEIPIIHLLSPMEPAELPVLEFVDNQALNEQPIIGPPAIQTPDLGPPDTLTGAMIISPESAPPILQEELPAADLATPEMVDSIPLTNTDTAIISPESLESNGLPTPDNQNSEPDLIPPVSLTSVTHENEALPSLGTTSPTLNIPIEEGLLTSNKPTFPVLHTNDFELTPKQAGSPAIPILMMPIMPYKFSYSVSSASSAVFTSHDEEQKPTGPLVGQYSYLRPDGIYMTVSYTADENGYRATVEESRTPPPSLVSLTNTPGTPQAPPTVPQSPQGPPSPAIPQPPTTLPPNVVTPLQQQPGTSSTDAPQPQFPNFPNIIISKPPQVSIIPQPGQPPIPFPIEPPPHTYPQPPNNVEPTTQRPATTPSSTTLVTDLPIPELPNFPAITTLNPPQPPNPPSVNPPIPGFPNFPNVIITKPPIIDILSTPEMTPTPTVSDKPQPNQPNMVYPAATPPPQSYLPPVPNTLAPQTPEIPDLITPQSPNPPIPPVPEIPPPFAFVKPKPEISETPITQIPDIPDIPPLPLQPQLPQSPPSVAFPPPHFPSFPNFIQPNPQPPQNPPIPNINPPTPQEPQFPPFSHVPQPNPQYPGGFPATQVYLPPSF